MGAAADETASLEAKSPFELRVDKAKNIADEDVHRALVSGDLQPADVPGAWNEKFNCGVMMIGKSPVQAVHADRVAFTQTLGYRFLKGQVPGIPFWEFAAKGG